jgi:uncharacterized protein
MKAVHMVAFLLLVIGGLNWLLVAVGYGIGNFIPEIVARVIYVVIGLAAIYEVATHKGNCKSCGVGGSQPSPTV